jgi:nitrite reductase/ring-hydroxylating ferredoxin subunit
VNIVTQQQLIGRIDAHRATGRGTDLAQSSMQVPVDCYTGVARLDAERAMLGRQPTLIGLSGLVPEPGSFATVDVGGSSVILTRDTGGTVNAMLNVCRHRGAEVVTGCGEAALLTCPYHGWTYGLDGASAARRRGEHFDDVEPAPLRSLPVLEQHGLIWVSADPSGSIPSEPLTGAETELAPFDLGTYRLFRTHEFTRPMNWKLGIDTFCEAYHLGSLHRNSLASLIFSDFAVFDAYGLHGRMVAVRRSITELDEIEPAERSLLPHATILWFLVPDTVLIHQQDHVEIYRSRPGSHPGEAVLSVAMYVPEQTARSDRYWDKNFVLLVDITDTEDFSTAAGIQRGFATGAQTHVTFGRNEPALQHFHRSIDALLGTPVDRRASAR